jgi:Fe-S-cluster containining protein
MNLPVISCEGCGACCSKQGTPPMLIEEYLALPKHLQWNRNKHASRYDYSLPCLWYDANLKRCSNYEHRGLVCREFEVGGPDCLTMREDLCSN